MFGCVLAVIDGVSAVKSIVPVSVNFAPLVNVTLLNVDDSGTVIFNCTKAPRCCISKATAPFSGVETPAAMKSYSPI